MLKHKTDITLEPVSFGDVEWETSLESFPERTVYQSRAWMSFVAATQNAEPIILAFTRRGEVVGLFAGLIVRKFGFKILGSSFPGWTTGYMGLVLRAEVSRSEALKVLMAYAFSNLGCVHLEIYDRNFSRESADQLGCEYRPSRSFEIDLRQSEDQLFAGMDNRSCRWCVRKAIRSGVKVEVSNGEGFAEAYYDQLNDVFAKQSLVPTYKIERVRKLIEIVHPTGMLLLLRALDPDGKCIATGIFPAANKTAYFWGGASYRKDQRLCPNELIQWQAMLYWKQHGMEVYDMGGGGEYKRKYGGTEIIVPWLQKSKYSMMPLLRNIAKNAFRYRQRLLGIWKKDKTSDFEVPPS